MRKNYIIVLVIFIILCIFLKVQRDDAIKSCIEYGNTRSYCAYNLR